MLQKVRVLLSGSYSYIVHLRHLATYIWQWWRDIKYIWQWWWDSHIHLAVVAGQRVHLAVVAGQCVHLVGVVVQGVHVCTAGVVLWAVSRQSGTSASV